MSKRPLVVVALLFAFGVQLGSLLPVAWEPLFGLGVIAGGMALGAPRGRRAWLAAQITIGGAFHFAWSTAPLPPHDLRNLCGDRPELATVRGRIATTPEHRLHARRGEIATNTLATLECLELSRAGREFQPVSGQVLITTPAPVPFDYPVGSQVEISGVLQVPPGPSAPGTFDYRRHLQRRGIHFELRAPTITDWRLPPGAKRSDPNWSERFQAWARRALAAGLPEEDAELRLLWAMTLGWRTGITDEVEEPFLQSGTMHVFAISGLHIALIAHLAVEVLRFARVPRVAAGLAVLPLCWAYTAATGWQPSAIRSTLMISFVILGWTLVRPLDLLNSLAAAALVCLIWEPAQLFQAGFQLSFAVVAALATLAPALHELLGRPFASDPFLPAALVPGWQRRLRRIWDVFRANLAVAVAAWLGSLPLGAHWFHLATPTSLLANLVVVPLSAAALASNLASLATTAWFPGLAEVFNHGAWFWMHLMLVASRRAAELPGGYWHVATPPIALSALWYLLLFGGVALLRGLSCRGTRRSLGGLALMLLVVGILEWHLRSPHLRVVVLPMRGGHAVWVRHQGPPDLVDTGDARSAEAVVRPFLVAEGINRLPRLFLTHGDIRHVGGATSILQRFQPGRVIPNPTKFRSPAWKNLLTVLDRAGPAFSTTNLARLVEPWRCLHPHAGDKFGRADDAALVLELADAPLRILLLADLGRLGQETLVQRYPNLRADLVIAGLPAGDDPLGYSLLAQLQPRLVIIADSELPATDRAKPGLRDRLREAGPLLTLFTSDTGSLDLRIDPAGNVQVLAADGTELARCSAPSGPVHEPTNNGPSTPVRFKPSSGRSGGSSGPGDE